MIDRSAAEQLLQDPDLDVTFGDKFTKETSAHLCCKNGHVDLLTKILAKNPDAGHVIDDQGNTPLHSLTLVSSSP